MDNLSNSHGHDANTNSSHLFNLAEGTIANPDIQLLKLAAWNIYQQLEEYYCSLRNLQIKLPLNGKGSFSLQVLVAWRHNHVISFTLERMGTFGVTFESNSYCI